MSKNAIGQLASDRTTSRQDIENSLVARRFETARRLCRALLKTTPLSERNALLWYLYDAYFGLNDFTSCIEVLDSLSSSTDDERLKELLCRAECVHRSAGHEYFTYSEAQRSGYSYDEYRAALSQKMSDLFAPAKLIANSTAQRDKLAQSLRACGRRIEAEAIAGFEPAKPVVQSPSRAGSGVLNGTMTFPDGQPIADAVVTLGLEVSEAQPDPLRYRHLMEHDFKLSCSPLERLTTRTDANGRFQFDQAPSGCHEFLAVNLDPLLYDVSLRFVAHKIHVAAETEVTFDAVVDEWSSTAPASLHDPLPEEFLSDGRRYTRIATDVLRNPFLHSFPRQALEIDVAELLPGDRARLILLSSEHPSVQQPFQVRTDSVFYFADLPPMTDRVFALYRTDEFPVHHAEPPEWLPEPDIDGCTATVDTGSARIKIPFGSSADNLPPIMSVMGADNIWRGEGRLVLPPDVQVIRRQTRVQEQGPLLLTFEIGYQLSNGAEYRFHLTFHRDEPYVLVREVSPPLVGASFEFSLREFLGGRGYLHWKADTAGMHWFDLKPVQTQLCRLEETVPWWCPPEGFGYAMTSSRPEQHDFIGVFTIRRGEWIDREFEKVASGPGDDQRELDWPQPEMVGSTISMITAHTTSNDAYFRFGLFDGERQWGLLVSTIAENEGERKILSEAQHKNSSPRLQEFKKWRLDHEDTLTRPNLLIDKSNLRNLRQRKLIPKFQEVYDRITTMRPNGGGQHNPNSSGGFRAIIDADPVLAWAKKRELVDIAQPHALSILLGRDYGDEYSPVGSRPVAPWAEDFDLIVATGVFTPEEERIARAHLMLLGHMYMQTDFTNWKFNARNANFEADRADTVGVVGLCFRDNPDGANFIAHAIARLESMLAIYCTPGSGRWYENVACYYLQSIKCWCNLAIHMARHGLIDPVTVPKMKEFLSWGINVLTPPTPASYSFMRDGGDDAAYKVEPKVRRISPIGDHANVGPRLPEHFVLMAKFFHATDCDFADRLRWAFHASGANGGYYGNPMLLYSMGDELDLVEPTELCTLASRRLEGFGAAFRGSFNADDEFFMLLKQGPGGYRYHRSEGSIILFADGKPLIYDGGEAGETWRHSTLSFYDSHTMLAAGHVERFHSFTTVDFVQGVHPLVLKPGEPDYLSYQCLYDQIPLALERFNEPNPADVRSVVWVKDEYVVVSDELNVDARVPTHWNLQAVAHDEIGDIESGFRFRGRFGTDFQLLLPGQESSEASIVYVPILEYHLSASESFGMRHLQVSGPPGTGRYLAVIRPLPLPKAEVDAKLLKDDCISVGVIVTGKGVRDTLFFAHTGTNYSDSEVSFRGKYAQVLIRDSMATLIIEDGELLAASGYTMSTNGPACQLRIGEDGIDLTTNGDGLVTVAFNQNQLEFDCSGEQQNHALQINFN